VHVDAPWERWLEVWSNRIQPNIRHLQVVRQPDFCPSLMVFGRVPDVYYRYSVLHIADYVIQSMPASNHLMSEPTQFRCWSGHLVIWRPSGMWALLELLLLLLWRHCQATRRRSSHVITDDDDGFSATAGSCCLAVSSVDNTGWTTVWETVLQGPGDVRGRIPSNCSSWWRCRAGVWSCWQTESCDPLATWRSPSQAGSTVCALCMIIPRSASCTCSCDVNLYAYSSLVEAEVAWAVLVTPLKLILLTSRPTREKSGYARRYCG